MNNLAKEIHAVNVKNGFYDDEKNIGEMLALIHSEVSEALEADRKGVYAAIDKVKFTLLDPSSSDKEFKGVFQASVKDSFEDELADIIIRALDLAAFKKINIEAHVKAKLRYNSLRAYKHGKKY